MTLNMFARSMGSTRSSRCARKHRFSSMMNCEHQGSAGPASSDKTAVPVVASTWEVACFASSPQITSMR